MASPLNFQLGLYNNTQAVSPPLNQPNNTGKERRSVGNAFLAATQKIAINASRLLESAHDKLTFQLIKRFQTRSFGFPSKGGIDQSSVIQNHQSINISNQVKHHFIQNIAAFSANPHMLYFNDGLKTPQFHQKNEALTTQIAQFGFKRPSINGYFYEGENPSQALRHLFNQKPLVLDCSSAVILAMYKSLLDVLGPHVFDDYIKTSCDGKLDITNQFPPLPYNVTVHYAARQEFVECDLPEQSPNALQHGDVLYVVGPQNAFAFHPCSELNSFNVVVHQQNSSTSLMGFVSQSTETHGKWSYSQLRELLLLNYHKPLTLSDVSFLKASTQSTIAQYAPYAQLTYQQAFAWLNDTQPEALQNAINRLSEPGVDLTETTELFAPPETHIRGVLQHTQIPADLSVASLRYSQKVNTVVNALNPIEKAKPCFTLPDYDTHLPHQQTIIQALNCFVSACTSNQSQSQFQGVVLYGNAGTGKTVACKAALQHLQQQGLSVWQAEFNDGENESLVKNHELFHLIQLHQSGGQAAVDVWLLNKLKPVWANADVLFVDDINNSYGVLNQVSNVALKYAKENNKKIIITTNTDPFSVFHRNLDFPVDSVLIRHIQGPDCRLAKAWHHVVDESILHSCPVPNDIQTRVLAHKIQPVVLTNNQKQMCQWLSVLANTQGQNGVAFYGGPGIGKTTLMKAFFASKQLNSIWIESHTVSQRFNLLNALAETDAEFLVIDDCNNTSLDSGYQHILFTLLNQEILLNKNQQPVKVVLVSNRKDWRELVDATSSWHKNLNPRMQSRYTGRFQSVVLASDQDFRAAGPKQGEFAQAKHFKMPSNVFRLEMQDYLNRRYECYAIISQKYQCNENGESHINPHTEATEKAEAEFLNLESSAKHKIASTGHVVFDLTSLPEIELVRVTSLLKHALDVMESNPEYRVTILSDNPQATRDGLLNGFKWYDPTGKYASRLQRLA